MTTTRFLLRRVSPASAARLGCALGWVVVLLPAMCLASLAGILLDRIYRVLSQVEPITLTVLGQEIARIDILASLNLQTAAQTIGRLVENQPATFLFLTLLLVATGSIFILAAAFLFSLGYNLLGSLGLGLVVEADAQLASPDPAHIQPPDQTGD